MCSASPCRKEKLLLSASAQEAATCLVAFSTEKNTCLQSPAVLSEGDSDDGRGSKREGAADRSLWEALLSADA